MNGKKAWTRQQMLFFAGLALWFGSTLVQTRMGAIVSLWTAALFVSGLLIVTLPTRTLTLAELIQPFCLGGAVLGIAVLAGWALDLAFGTKESGLRVFSIPFIEETLKIAPVLLVLWRYQQGRIWTLSATDVVLLAAVSGAGFYWVEEAFIIHHQGSWAFLGSFPTTEVISDRHGSHFIAGHALWTSIAGITIGLGLLLRGSKLQILLIGASGWLWSAFDHGANNYNANYRDSLNRVFQVVTGNGHLSLYIFVVGAGLAVALDFYFAYLALPALAEVKLPAFPSSWADAKRAWRYLRMRREFAYAVARYRRASGLPRARAAVVAASIDAGLQNWHLSAAGENRA
jgi:RsiW-degrading membrane proteinase PrsW (M82 family)